MVEAAAAATMPLAVAMKRRRGLVCLPLLGSGSEWATGRADVPSPWPEQELVPLGTDGSDRAATVPAWVMDRRRPELNSASPSPGGGSRVRRDADGRGRVSLLSGEQTRGGAGPGHPVDSPATAGTRLLHRDRGTSSSRRAVIVDAPVALSGSVARV